MLTVDFVDYKINVNAVVVSNEFCFFICNEMNSGALLLLLLLRMQLQSLSSPLLSSRLFIYYLFLAMNFGDALNCKWEWYQYLNCNWSMALCCGVRLYQYYTN